MHAVLILFLDFKANESHTFVNQGIRWTGYERQAKEIQLAIPGTDYWMPYDVLLV
jgi:hypothetical protein